MIVDKKNNKVISGNKTSAVSPPTEKPKEQPEKPLQVASNGPMDVLKAMKAILRSVTWEYGVSGSPKIFSTVQIDDGQYERIISPNGNK